MAHHDRAKSRTRERDQTHSYWYIPSAPRVNYSLLVMETVEMIKMATVDGFPSGRVPERAPDWFFMATKGCGGGTPDLGFFWGVSLFIGITGIENKSGGSMRSLQGRRARPGGRARAPPLWRPRVSSGPTLLLRGLLLVHKKSP